MKEQQLNVYTFDYGKPMVWNLETARRFALQCKHHPFYIKTSRGYYKILAGTVSLYTTTMCGCIGIDFEEWKKTGEDAVRAVWALRKYINAHFRD